MSDATLTDRLSVLKAKRDDKAITLTPAEKIELQELTLKQRTLRLAKQKTVLAEQKRKAENALKYKLGGLVLSVGLSDVEEATVKKVLTIGRFVMDAGLGDWDEAALRGVMIAVAKTNDPAALVAWRNMGGATYNAELKARQAKTGALAVQFPAAPAEDVTTALRVKGLAWDEANQRWSGQGIPSEIQAIVVPAGGTVLAA